MRARWFTVSGLISASLWGPALRPGHAGCESSIAIVHMANGTAMGGAFIIPERAGKPNGPELRFWLFGQYLTANNGRQGQFDAGRTWLSGQAAIPGAEGGPDHFWLIQANWMGPQVQGCVMHAPLESRRTVVELSYLAEENRPSHYTGYLIASVGFVSGSDFNFDNVTDGNAGGAKIKLVPIPVPEPVGVATASSSHPDFMDVMLQIPDARSYGDSGAPNLIAGYEIFYKNDAVPVSSDPGHYTPVRNPQAVSSVLGFVPYGVGSVKVSVRTPQSATYFAMRIRYVDGTTTIYSRGTSGHSAAVVPPGGEKADKAASPTPTPQSADAAPTPTPVAEEDPRDAAAAGAGAEGGSARARTTPVTPATAAPASDASASASSPTTSVPALGGVSLGSPGTGMLASELSAARAAAGRTTAPAVTGTAGEGERALRLAATTGGGDLPQARSGAQSDRLVEPGAMIPGASGPAQSVALGLPGVALEGTAGPLPATVSGSTAVKPVAGDGWPAVRPTDGTIATEFEPGVESRAAAGSTAIAGKQAQSQLGRAAGTRISPWLLLDGVVGASIVALGLFALGGRPR